MEAVRWKDGLYSAYEVVEEIPGQRLLIVDVPETGKHGSPCVNVSIVSMRVCQLKSGSR